MKKVTAYESLGFVEALIAIIVVGASSIVLMQIAVSTMQGMIQNDTIDKMTQYAVEGAEIVQDIANRDKASNEENLFPNIDEVFVGRECFVFTATESEGENVSLSNYNFLKNGEAGFVTYAYGTPFEYKSTGVIPSDEELFRLVCLEYPQQEIEEDTEYVTARIIVGQVNSDGTITKGNQVKDYTYFSIIKL